MRAVIVLLIVAATALPWRVEAAHAADTVVVQAGGVQPPVLQTTTGTRVEFQNRTGRAVHLEFEGDSRLHEIVQNPATGPFWVIFRRAGIHRYVVHVYETRERALPGAVEVAEDPGAPSTTSSCSVAVRGICVEP